MHISLPTTLQLKLDDYVKNRRGKAKSKSGAIHRALELFFNVEADTEPTEAALSYAVGTKFAVPRSIPLRSFYMFLYMLAKNYPQHSSRRFWTEVVYLLKEDLTHQEIYDDIRAEFRRFGSAESVQSGRTPDGVQPVAGDLSKVQSDA